MSLELFPCAGPYLGAFNFGKRRKRREGGKRMREWSIGERVEDKGREEGRGEIDKGRGGILRGVTPKVDEGEANKLDCRAEGSVFASLQSSSPVS